MQATIDVHEDRGIFATRWTVTCQISFTDVEESAIRHGKLRDNVVYSLGSGEMQRRVTLGEIIANQGRFSQTFKTISAARADRDFIEETILPVIKSWIVEVEGFGPETRTIEL